MDTELQEVPDEDPKFEEVDPKEELLDDQPPYESEVELIGAHPLEFADDALPLPYAV